MKVVCKIKDTDGYYSKITPEKEYTILETDNFKGIGEIYYTILNDEGKKGLYQCRYFYTQQELREVKLNTIF